MPAVMTSGVAPRASERHPIRLGKSSSCSPVLTLRGRVSGDNGDDTSVASARFNPWRGTRTEQQPIEDNPPMKLNDTEASDR